MLLNAFRQTVRQSVRFELICLIVLPFLFWIFCFRDFIFCSLGFSNDAVSYYQHIGFFTDNISKGIYPLWDPFWCDGAPYHFFLRRIGDVNPLFMFIVMLKWVGVSHEAAYIAFILFNYFLAMVAFYLIAKRLFKDAFFAFTCYVLLLFSCWGTQLFYTYIILIFLPIIWFFYFLMSFANKQKPFAFIGMFFCAGIILTTYIPFYFLIILTIFTLTYALFYGRQLLDFAKQSFIFVNSHRLLTALCAAFLIMSCIPALIFYQESKAGEFVLPLRHAGSDESSAVAVSISNVTSGDIINNGSFDKTFEAMPIVNMGDFYIPHLFFIFLLCMMAGRVNKFIYFIFANLVLLAAITTTNAASLHQFLYDHVVLFKFIRNIYYFFWLAILPLGVLMAVAGFKSLLQAIETSSNKIGWSIYLLLCHVAFILFIFLYGSATWAVVTATLLSLAYFGQQLWGNKRYTVWAGIGLIFLAAFIQSADVYSHFKENFNGPQKNEYTAGEYSSYPYTRKVSSAEQESATANEDMIAGLKFNIYYSTTGYALLTRYINPHVLDVYSSHKFYWVDKVLPYDNQDAFLKRLESDMRSRRNVAYILRSGSSVDDWRANPSASAYAQPVEGPSAQLKVIGFTANTLVIKTKLDQERFLVINDNYNSGWHATINGQPVKLFMTNGSYKGLWVPPGESVITLQFSSVARYCLHVSLMLMFMAVFIYWVILMVNERRRQEDQAHV